MQNQEKGNKMENSRSIRFRAWEIDWKNNGKKQGRMIQWEDIRDDFATILSRTSSFILMQSTGLFDKNGKEIYEGDVVVGTTSSVFAEWKKRGPSEVFYDNGQWQPFSYLGVFDGTQYEVIGTIYSNPELLS